MVFIMAKLRFLSLIISMVLSITTMAHAKTYNGAERQAKLTAVETYLNQLKTVKSSFVQTAYDGYQLGGTFYLNRPGRLRFEYAPPLEDFIVADGIFIYFYDAEMEQQSNTTIGNSLADFILRKDIKLSGDVTVTQVQEFNGILQVTLHQTEEPDAGSLTLAFLQEPLRLHKWRVLDAQGGLTEIALTNMETDVSLSSELFYFRDPRREKRGMND